MASRAEIDALKAVLAGLSESDIVKVLGEDGLQAVISYIRNAPATDEADGVLVTDGGRLRRMSFVTLASILYRTYFFEVSATPSDAKVVINGEERGGIEMMYGGTVEWEVSAEHYVSQSGSAIVTEDTRLDVALALEQFTFGINATPSDAKVIINGEERASITADYGTEIEWEVSCDGYVSKSGTATVTEDMAIDVALTALYTFAINATPSDAKVVINGEERTSITVEDGTEIEWEVSCDDYISKSGTATVTEDMAIDVALMAEPFIFVYDSNSMYIYRGTACSSSSTDCLFAINGDYDIEINGVMIEDVSASTTFGSAYLNASGNIVKIYPHEGTTINRRYSSTTNASSYNQTRKISEIQSWGGATFGECAYMFAMSGLGVSTLKKVPKLSKGFAGATSMAYMFYDCNSIEELADGLFDNCPNVTTFAYCFYNCRGIAALSDGLFANCPNVTTFAYCFYFCSYLTALPENIFEGCTKVTNFSYCFPSCTGLTAIPENLFASCTKVTNFSYCFYGVNGTNNLTGESAYDRVDINGVETIIHLYERENYPDLYTNPKTTTACYHYQNKLDDYDSIPDEWK